MSPRDKAVLLRNLHRAPPVLVLPNAWDAVSARLIAAEGFPVIATSSSGCAAVLGYHDGQQIPRAEMIFLLSKVVASVEVPVTADVESGYGDAVQTALEVIAAGAVGLNLEDMADGELIPLATQVETIRAVRAACESAGVPLVLNARTDIFLARHGPEGNRFERAVERLNAFHNAGADCLFAPGVRDSETIGRLVRAIQGPLNILATAGSPAIPEMQSLGVARVSFGGGPSRLALGAVRQFTRELRDHGTFDGLGGIIPFAEVEQLLGRSQ